MFLLLLFMGAFGCEGNQCCFDWIVVTFDALDTSTHNFLDVEENQYCDMIIRNCLYFGVHPETAFKILDKGRLWNFALLKADTRFNLYISLVQTEREYRC